MSEKIQGGTGDTIGKITGDGQTVLGKNNEVVGHISSDGRTQYDKDHNVVGHSSADGRESYNEKWEKTGSTSKDGKTSLNTGGEVSGRTRGSGLLSGGLFGGAVNLLRAHAQKQSREKESGQGGQEQPQERDTREKKRHVSDTGGGRHSDTHIGVSLFLLGLTIFCVLFPLIIAFFGAVFVGFFVSLAAIYQLYKEKNQPEDFQNQNWLRNGVSTRWFRMGGLLGKLPTAKLVKFRDFETPDRIGLFLGIPSSICGLLLLFGAFSASGQRQTADMLANIVVGLILFSQGIFLFWAGYHFNSVRDTTGQAVPPPIPPPGA